jgi:uncharacterized protein (UPF0261 family)
LLAEKIAALCNIARGPFRILIPLDGFSSFDHKKGPMHDPKAPSLFDQTLRDALMGDISPYSLPYHINDEQFALAVVETLENLTGCI